MNQKQADAARLALIEWLEHPSELGMRPAKMECVGTVELHGMLYYLFRYKKALAGGPWLLGVCGGYEDAYTLEHCGHVFSDMQPYDPATAGERAAQIVDTIRSYWQQCADALQEQAEELAIDEDVFLQAVEWTESDALLPPPPVQTIWSGGAALHYGPEDLVEPYTVSTGGKSGRYIFGAENELPRTGTATYGRAAQANPASVNPPAALEAPAMEDSDGVLPYEHTTPGEPVFDAYGIPFGSDALPTPDSSTVEAPAATQAKGDMAAAEHQSEEAEPAGDTGSFLAFVLLGENRWDATAFVAELESNWGLHTGQAHGGPTSTLVWEQDGMLATVGLMPAPVPNGEAMHNAANNYLWPGAVEAAEKHAAHLLVAVLPRGKPLLAAGELLVKLCDACLASPDALGVYVSGTVFEPHFYRQAATMMHEGLAPCLNWVYFGLCHGDGGLVSGYTYGLETFGKREIEILDAQASLSELHGLLVDIASYVLTEDVTLEDGQTIGASEEQMLPISISPGVFLEGDTVKIGYMPLF